NETMTRPSRASGTTWIAWMALGAANRIAPATTQAATSRRRLRLIPLELIDLAFEFADVAELPVDRREPHVGDLVDAAQLLHDERADVGRPDFPLRPVLQLRLDAVGNPLELLYAHRALLARPDEAADQLLPVEGLGPAVLLDDAVFDLFDMLAARIALAAA